MTNGVPADVTVPVFRDKYAKGWPANPDGEHAVYTPIGVAMSKTYDTDAHFCAYSVPEVPRRLATAEVFAELSDGLTMILFVVDVDAPEHSAGDEWWAGERDKLSRLLADQPSGFVFRTRGGYRIVYWLANPVVLYAPNDAEQWKSRYVAWIEYLTQCYAIVGDKACKDWTRFYRLPRVFRDGERQDRETIGDPHAIGTWDVTVEMPTQTALTARQPTTEHVGTIGTLTHGERHPTMLSLAGAMRRRGADEATMFAALEKFNAMRCSPPKPAAELYEIARFVGGKAPARPASSRAYDRPPSDASDPGDPWPPSPSSPPPDADSPPPGEPDGSDSDADPESDDPKLTELGNAQRFARMHGSRMRYVHKWRKWLLWDGRRWCRDEIGSEDTAAKQVVHKLYGDAARVSARAAQIATIDGDPKAETKLATAIMKHAVASSKASAIRAIVKLAQSEPPIAAPAGAFDRDGWVLNVENGTIDLRTGLLRAHRQTDMITMVANVSYDPDAQCPRWAAFLERVLPDHDTQSWLQRFLGYCLTGDASEHVLAFLHGSGANGKSVLLDTMINILGDYGMRAAPDLVLAKYGETHPTEFADLEGRRLVLVSEIDQGRAWSEATIKRITGDTTIKARLMRRDFIEFPVTYKLVIAANTKPVVRSTDDGIWRRMRLVSFGVTIPPAERDKGLIAKLLEERAGILAWAVRGCLAWQHEGLGNAGAVDKATAEYRKAQDILGNWIEEQCVVGSDEFTPMAKLYESYTGWCAQAGYDKPWKRDTVRDRLLEREGLTERRTASARGIQGLGLRSSHSHLAVSR